MRAYARELTTRHEMRMYHCRIHVHVMYKFSISCEVFISIT